MKITRNQFLKLIPAAALTLTGCGSKAQPANTESLVFSHHYKLDYAQQFTADCYEGGYTMLTIAESDTRFLVVPEDAAEVDSLPADVTVLRQPVENIYLVSTSVMDLLLHLDALDSVAFSGTKAEGWYLPAVQQAMKEGKIAYAGKYSAPDYEQILAAGCRLAIENTMILHTPEVKEQLEHFGIPVLVERSSYESSPLARMEWIKLYAALLDKEDEAEALFNEKCENVHVVNELDVPILCMGLKDVVISASPEGILVSDKEQSSYIKPYVDKIDQQIMFAEKSWGSFRVLDVEDESLTIKVTLNPGHSMNYHSHMNRDEVWVVISGTGRTVVDGVERPVHVGDVVQMQAGCRHTVLADSELQLIEVQLGKEISVHDKQKFPLEQETTR